MAIERGQDEPVDWDHFQRVIERVKTGQDKAFNPRPDFDAKLAKEVREDRTQGRKIADYVKALEYLGFEFFTADQLNMHPSVGPMFGPNGPILHKLGQWRNERDAARWPQIRMAFTSVRICEDYPSPREFFDWYADKRKRAQLAELGLALPPPGLVLT